MLDVTEWRQKFDAISKTEPKEGDELTGRNGQKVKLTVSLEAGKEPLIYTRAYVPQTVGEEPAWVLQGQNESFNFGWKVLLRPKSRDDVIRKFGLIHDSVLVNKIRIVRKSRTGDSLQGEIVEW